MNRTLSSVSVNGELVCTVHLLYVMFCVGIIIGLKFLTDGSLKYIYHRRWSGQVVDWTIFRIFK